MALDLAPDTVLDTRCTQGSIYASRGIDGKALLAIHASHNDFEPTLTDNEGKHFANATVLRTKHDGDLLRDLISPDRFSGRTIPAYMNRLRIAIASVLGRDSAAKEKDADTRRRQRAEGGTTASVEPKEPPKESPKEPPKGSAGELRRRHRKLL